MNIKEITRILGVALHSTSYRPRAHISGDGTLGGASAVDRCSPSHLSAREKIQANVVMLADYPLMHEYNSCSQRTIPVKVIYLQSSPTLYCSVHLMDGLSFQSIFLGELGQGAAVYRGFGFIVACSGD